MGIVQRSNHNKLTSWLKEGLIHIHLHIAIYERQNSCLVWLQFWFCGVVSWGPLNRGICARRGKGKGKGNEKEIEEEGKGKRNRKRKKGKGKGREQDKERKRGRGRGRGREGKGKRKGRDRKGQEGTGRDRKGQEGQEGTGRDRKGQEGTGKDKKGREGQERKRKEGKGNGKETERKRKGNGRNGKETEREGKGRKGKVMVWSELFALNFGFVLDSLRITDRNHISRKWQRKKGRSRRSSKKEASLFVFRLRSQEKMQHVFR